MKLSTLDIVALVLVIVGGINWGLLGALKFNLVEVLLGQGLVAAIVYILVGLSAIYLAIVSPKLERKG